MTRTKPYLKTAYLYDNARGISVSIVSHGHGQMVEQLVASILELCPEVTEIILTKNIPEDLRVSRLDRVTVIEKSAPQGFGHNHNEAFRVCHGEYFCVLNPDIQLVDNPFAELAASLQSFHAGIAVPVVKAGDGTVEDSVRHFPTLPSLARKLLLGDRGSIPVHKGVSGQFVDWGAGMFMLFTRASFEILNGFDCRYFMYYEDADICLRAWESAIPVILVPHASVIHHARRDSHRRIGFLLIHLRSMCRYFWKYGPNSPKVRSIPNV